MFSSFNGWQIPGIISNYILFPFLPLLEDISNFRFQSVCSSYLKYDPIKTSSKSPNYFTSLEISYLYIYVQDQ